ncbi:uncharacterized protein PFL1_00601 [Pseudozyma flocculosa PF-1]|uniref:Uncharacterized protein n=1 Tax=Pseudozyma flocculosa TaxID=84751 RepID=A0A5C3ESY1_9BASI|nr:uncharacterized protein PFL1_00601 [Pseudozyma flocculosa PF-1]EPQ32405.1 hypothetical protein PFL1_00601 [Pseudozyma flocculosa PF-1]SPO34616.1 uncharacterized protein PSFLO_00087 [Pseudozyma flocculosa]
MVSLKLTAAAALAIMAATFAEAAPTEAQPVQLEERTFGLLWQYKSNFFCKAPWLHASKPYWCHGIQIPGIPTWDGAESAKCKHPLYALLHPWCKKGNTPQPNPPNCQPSPGPAPGGDGPDGQCTQGYKQVYKNYESTAETGAWKGQVKGAATIDNENYITYGLVPDLDHCLDACDAKEGCVFVNLYQDNADSPEDIAELPPSAQEKYQKGKLTCAMYRACSGTDKATNWAGQQDPTYITESSAYCRGAGCQK